MNIFYMEETGDWWVDFEEDGIDGELPHFCNSPTRDMQVDSAPEPALLDSIPPDLGELNDSPLLKLDVPGEKEAPLEAGYEEKWRRKNKLTMEVISKYFHYPVTEAAKELKTGITQLKKRCRELGIPRWPQRKIMSFSSLIANVKEIVPEEGDTGESKVRRARAVLEREMQAMVRAPGTEMGDATKRLRQACFKAAFKKRKMNNHVAGRKVPRSSSSSSSSASPAETGASPGNGNGMS